MFGNHCIFTKMALFEKFGRFFIREENDSSLAEEPLPPSSSSLIINGALEALTSVPVDWHEHHTKRSHIAQHISKQK